MRPELYSADKIVKLLRKRKIATIDDLKRTLGTKVDVTVFRKLKELSYRTSYSHRGSFYTLDEVVDFDEKGLWSFRSVWFSIHGSLKATAETFVKKSEAGYFASELEHVLNVAVKETLLQLVREKQISREKYRGVFLYTSRKRKQKTKQLAIRRALDAQPGLASSVPVDEVLPDELLAAIVLFYSLLDEKQRRLYAGLESLKIGHGGDRRIAELLGLDSETVAKGRRQILAGDVDPTRIRSPGAGRKPVKKKRRVSSRPSKS